MSTITHRMFAFEDLPMLEKALDQDTYEHANTNDYIKSGGFSEVYEGEKGPICVLRYSKTLRIMAVWCKNEDRRRNAVATIQATKDAISRAKESGFTDIIFETESPSLADFCEQLGFKRAGNTLVLHIEN